MTIEGLRPEKTKTKRRSRPEKRTRKAPPPGNDKPEEEHRNAPCSEEDSRPSPARKQNAETNDRFEQDNARKLNERLLEENNRANAARKQNAETNERFEQGNARKLNESSLEENRASAARYPNTNTKDDRTKQAKKTFLAQNQSTNTNINTNDGKTEQAKKTVLVQNQNRNTNDGRNEQAKKIVLAENHNTKTHERSQEDDRTSTAGNGEVDRTMLAGVSSSPPRRKNQSYNQQLRTNTAPHNANKHQQELRKHSLDENRVNNGSHYKGNSDNFYPCSTVTGIVVESVKDHNVDLQRIEADGGGGNDDPSHPLMEFTGNGGSVGRHPLRETQVGKFIRTITSTEVQLWAGQESGVRVWNYADAYKPGGRYGREGKGEQ